MDKRIQIDEIDSSAIKPFIALESYLHKSELDSMYIELIKIRASQLNGCSFCLDMHTKDALKKGESQQRIFLLNAWWETDLFAEEEKIILKITEEITMIHDKGLTDETYKRAIETFGERYLTNIIMAVITINSWNRIAISTHKPIAS